LKKGRGRRRQAKTDTYANLERRCLSQKHGVEVQLLQCTARGSGLGGRLSFRLGNRVANCLGVLKRPRTEVPVRVGKRHGVEQLEGLRRRERRSAGPTSAAHRAVPQRKLEHLASLQSVHVAQEKVAPAPVVRADNGHARL
jgi:hypothetical protein